MTTADKPPQRRKPAQSRARVTSEAIQQAFVQLLAEKGYAKVTIREVISLAGVGIGSFYEYFSSKDALAAVCIHLRVKGIAQRMRQCIEARRGEPLPVLVDALLDAQIHDTLAEPEQWAALFLLERQLSGIAAYRKGYEEFVQLWQQALASAIHWPPGAPAHEAAFVAHATAYSLTSQALMTQPRVPDPVALRRMLRTAVHGYLSVLAPLAYRLHRFGE
ncbi:MAG: TetR/AcrR family transcriptional regulator [Polaromonas sp.]